MNSDDLSNPLVKRAIAALNAGDRTAWFASFTSDATLTDDGKKQDFARWSDDEIFGEGGGRLVAIDREEDGGLALYGRFHSARWGSFKTFFRFRRRGDRLSALDVGQIDD